MSNLQLVDFDVDLASDVDVLERLEYPRFARANADSEIKWQIEVQNQILNLTNLPERWDSYTAEKIRWDVGMFALRILSDIMEPRSPVPHVVPLASGGLQLEWHEKGIDLEINIVAPYEAEIWYQDLETGGQPVELQLVDNYSALVVPIKKLTQR